MSPLKFQSLASCLLFYSIPPSSPYLIPSISISFLLFQEIASLLVVIAKFHSLQCQRGLRKILTQSAHFRFEKSVEIMAFLCPSETFQSPRASASTCVAGTLPTVSASLHLSPRTVTRRAPPALPQALYTYFSFFLSSLSHKGTHFSSLLHPLFIL